VSRKQQWLIVVAVLAVLVAYPVWSEVHYARQIYPAGVAAVRDFYGRFGEPRRVEMLRRDGQVYYEFTGPLPSRWVLAVPSAPPVYVFDARGDFVTWCRDPGDMPSYRHDWPVDATNQIDMQSLKQKFGL
jgi:hypothetical protein